jgi:transposase-like protein
MNHSKVLKLNKNFKDKKPLSTEVSTKQFKRPYSTAFKLKVLKEAAGCEASGEELGAMLRRVGVSSTSLHRWRLAQALGELNAKTPEQSQKVHVLRRIQENKLLRLERENSKLKAIIELQKKISEFMKTFQESSSEDIACN